MIYCDLSGNRPLGLTIALFDDGGGNLEVEPQTSSIKAINVMETLDLTLRLATNPFTKY